MISFLSFLSCPVIFVGVAGHRMWGSSEPAVLPQGVRCEGRFFRGRTGLSMLDALHASLSQKAVTT